MFRDIASECRHNRWTRKHHNSKTCETRLVCMAIFCSPHHKRFILITAATNPISSAVISPASACNYNMLTCAAANTLRNEHTSTHQNPHESAARCAFMTKPRRETECCRTGRWLHCSTRWSHSSSCSFMHWYYMHWSRDPPRGVCVCVCGFMYTCEV